METSSAARPIAVTGAVVTLASLATEWFRVPLFTEGYRGFAGYQVAVLGVLLATASVLVLAGTLLDRPWAIVASSLAIAGMVAVFLGVPDPVIRATWRWNSGGLECLERCLSPEGYPGAFVALAGGGLGLLGGILRWRRKSPAVTATGPPPSAPA